jgi:hypothetical protein
MANLHLDLAELVEKCRAALLQSTPRLIAYTDIADLRNNSLPSDLVLSPINIYALWTRAEDGDWRVKYIGQRSIKKGWSRVCEHLFWKHPKTQSKLDQVLQALLAGEEIGVTGILVTPDSLRLAVEAELISYCSKDDGLPWNQKGKVPSKRSNSSSKPVPPHGVA